jgi:hypothetical protein
MTCRTTSFRLIFLSHQSSAAGTTLLGVLPGSLHLPSARLCHFSGPRQTLFFGTPTATSILPVVHGTHLILASLLPQPM